TTSTVTTTTSTTSSTISNTSQDSEKLPEAATQQPNVVIIEQTRCCTCSQGRCVSKRLCMCVQKGRACTNCIAFEKTCERHIENLEEAESDGEESEEDEDNKET